LEIYHHFGLQFMMFSKDLLIDLLRAKRILVFTDAGMSAESGIATFREGYQLKTGLWARYDAHRLTSPEGYELDKALV
jgi:NAD-dependent deacetylase